MLWLSFAFEDARVLWMPGVCTCLPDHLDLLCVNRCTVGKPSRVCPGCDVSKIHDVCCPSSDNIVPLCPDCDEAIVPFMDVKRLWLRRIVSLSTPGTPGEIIIPIPESDHTILFWPILQSIMECDGGAQFLITDMDALRILIAGIQEVTLKNVSNKRKKSDVPFGDYMNWLGKYFLPYDTWFACTNTKLSSIGHVASTARCRFEYLAQFVDPDKNMVEDVFNIMKQDSSFNHVSIEVSAFSLCLFWYNVLFSTDHGLS